jgi:hypothetical protein
LHASDELLVSEDFAMTTEYSLGGHRIASFVCRVVVVCGCLARNHISRPLLLSGHNWQKVKLGPGVSESKPEGELGMRHDGQALGNIAVLFQSKDWPQE